MMAWSWRNLAPLFSFCKSLRIFQGRWKAVVAQDAHTIRSHGSAIAKEHLHDWLILLLLAAIEAVLYTVHPFYRFVGKDMMDDLKYPFQSATLPTWSVPIYAVLLPIGIFGFFYIRRREVYDLHHSILGLLYAVLITGVITDVIKNAVGRPRPDFFWRCFPDGIEFYEKLGNVACHGKASDIKEGHRSFPSGHASWSFAGLGFLSLYLSGKIKAFDRTGHIAKHCILFLPLLAASLVGISRIDDYWHHWTDVVAGGLIGLVVTTFCYLQFFPPPYDKNGWGSHAYIRSLVESGANSHQLQASNTHGQVMKYPEITQLSGQTGYLLQVSGSHHNASPISDDLEARRVV